MASVSKVLAAALLAGCCALQKDSAKLMRQHNKVQMGSRGDLRAVEDPYSHTDKVAKNVQAQERAQEKAIAEAAKIAKITTAEQVEEDKKSHRRVDMLLAAANAAKHSTREDMCNINFVRGDAGTSTCPDDSERMQEPAECETAAELSCPDRSCLGGPSFSLNLTQQTMGIWDERPKGCYVSTDGTWNYNPVGGDPDPGPSDSYIPVCEQPEYLEGTADSAEDCGSDSYEPILSNDECLAAAGCTNKCRPDVFMIIDVANQNKRPKGCFIATEGSFVGCALFNNMTTATPTAPKGKPYCKRKPTGGD